MKSLLFLTLLLVLPLQADYPVVNPGDAFNGYIDSGICYAYSLDTTSGTTYRVSVNGADGSLTVKIKENNRTIVSDSGTSIILSFRASSASYELWIYNYSGYRIEYDTYFVKER